MKLRVIITGATGMVGEGVLHESLYHEDVEQVLIVNRKPSGIQHPKLKEIIHKDFFDLSPIAEQLRGNNACFFCLGVSSVGLKEKEFHRLTYTLTMHFAETLASQNKDLIFSYISGTGTDSSEKARSMWARVKGKTENDLRRLGFIKTYAFRPGILRPTKGLKNTLKLYKYFGWLYPIIKGIFPNHASTLKELGLAMILASSRGYDKNIVEVKDIVALARQK